MKIFFENAGQRMNIMNLLEYTKKICRENNIAPTRSKGQNFLINESVYDKIVAAADLKPDDIILEAGPGLGILTVRLARAAKKVIAVELDDKLVNALKEGLAEQGIVNAEVVNMNILDFKITPPPFLKGGANNDATPASFLKGGAYQNFPLHKGVLSGFEKASNNVNGALYFQLSGGNYKIVANLPYNITSIFLRKFLSQEESKPELMVLMLQKEVAERIIAKPPKMSLLAVSVQYYAVPKIAEYVPKDDFWPRPDVDSAIVKLKINPSASTFKEGSQNAPFHKGRLRGFVDNEKEFFRLVKFGFSSRRKMLKNNLAAGYRISPVKAENYLKLAKIPLKIRAQDLSMSDWFKLFEVIMGNVV